MGESREVSTVGGVALAMIAAAIFAGSRAQWFVAGLLAIGGVVLLWTAAGLTQNEHEAYSRGLRDARYNADLIAWKERYDPEPRDD